MKKIIIFIAVTAFGLLLAKTGQAKVWLSPYAPYGDYKAGNCTLVNTKAEADTTHVYTLNPDFTYNINLAYRAYWDRDARCDELQFHVDHNTPGSRLTAWLKNTAISWYKNIGATHFKNQTVSTSNREWFYVDSQGIHRIPDVLTGWSWGLLINDRLAIPSAMTAEFYSNVKIGSPLNFSTGQYASKITTIWKDGDRDFSTLPTKLADDINNLIKQDYGNIFEKCQYSARYSSDPLNNLLDWTWMLHNPGCPLAD